MSRTLADKICFYCKITLPMASFYFRKRTGKHSGMCKACFCARARERYPAHPKPKIENSNPSSIRLSSGQIAEIDPDMHAVLAARTWRINQYGYAVAGTMGSNRACTRFLMHRVVIDAKNGQVVDHINGNKLDNRRANLRICTQQQNMCNKPWAAGVYWSRERRKWVATIQIKRKGFYLGAFAERSEALVVRRIAERKYFGEFAPVRSEP